MVRTPAKVLITSLKSEVLATKCKKSWAEKRKTRSPLKNAPTTGGVIRPLRYKPGVVALREIRRYQKTFELLLRKMPFVRVIKEVLQDIYPSNTMRWESTALLALQVSTEAYLIAFFEYTNIVAINAKRVTIMAKDMRVVRRIRGVQDPGN